MVEQDRLPELANTGENLRLGEAARAPLEAVSDDFDDMRAEDQRLGGPVIERWENWRRALLTNAEAPTPDEP